MAQNIWYFGLYKTILWPKVLFIALNILDLDTFRVKIRLRGYFKVTQSLKEQSSSQPTVCWAVELCECVMNKKMNVNCDRPIMRKAGTAQVGTDPDTATCQSFHQPTRHVRKLIILRLDETQVSTSSSVGKVTKHSNVSNIFCTFYCLGSFMFHLLIPVPITGPSYDVSV